LIRGFFVKKRIIFENKLLLIYEIIRK